MVFLVWLIWLTRTSITLFWIMDVLNMPSIGNVKITSTHCGMPIENSDKWEHYTTINCWYDRDCEHCPMGWEDIGYEGECGDCGCLFNYEFNVPIWKCMLPRWLKKIILNQKYKREELY